MSAAQPSHEERAELLQIYAAVIETADRVSDRRQAANSYYFTLVSAAFAGFFASYQVEQAPPVVRPLVCAFGILVCLVWFASILSFRRQNSAKFRAIGELEQRLPFAFFAAEEVHLRRRRLRARFTTIELLLPPVIAAGFVLLLVLTGA